MATVRKRNIDNATIMDATHWSKKTIERVQAYAETFKTDPDKKTRLLAHECMVCFYYSGRVGGAAMTHTECGICGTEKVFSNTCVDVLCKKCAIELNLCLHCGGDIESKQRKKQRF